MRVFDITKTNELTTYDLAKGYLKPERLLIAHHEAVAAVPEQWHRELIAAHKNGGKSYRRVVDAPAVPAREAWDEYEEIQVFVPYTEKELAEREIGALKAKLAASDYQAIKYAEGLISEGDYMPIKTERQGWRDRINELEERMQ